EYEATQDGVIARLAVAAGTEVKVGEPIAYWADGDEAMSPSPLETPPSPAQPPILRVSPLARRLAREGGLDLVQIKGSGPLGRILRADVLAAVAVAPESQPRPQPQPPEPIAPHPPVTSPEPVAKPQRPASALSRPVTGMRRTIAERLTASRRDIPQFCVEVDCQRDPLLALRQRSEERRVGKA